MSENQVSCTTSYDDDVGLLDLLSGLKENWKMLMTAAMAGLLFALGVGLLMTPQYESAAQIRVGQVSGNVIETLPVVLQRMNSDAFMERLCALRGGCDDDQVNTMKKKIRIIQPKQVDLLQISVKAGSKDEVALLTRQIVEVIAADHEGLARPIRRQIEARLAQAKARLKAYEAERARIRGRLEAGNFDLKNAYSTLQLVDVSGQRELAALNEQVLSLQQQLELPATRPTELLQEVSVSRNPVSPKMSLMLIYGVMAGAVLGMLAVFVRQALRKRLQQAA